MQYQARIYTPETRKSSCVNARGIPPAVYWVLLLLSYLGTPPSWPGWGGTWPGYPPWQGTPPGQGTPPVLTWPGGYLTRVPPWQGTPPQGTPPARPGRVPPQQGTPLAGPGRVPPSRVPPWQGTPPAGYPPSRVPPPPSWTWQGTPPPVSAPWHSGKCCKAKHYGIWVPPCEQTDGRTDACQNITFPSYYVRGR